MLANLTCNMNRLIFHERRTATEQLRPKLGKTARNR
jgi:hypothetical protein